MEPHHPLAFIDDWGPARRRLVGGLPSASKGAQPDLSQEIAETAPEAEGATPTSSSPQVEQKLDGTRLRKLLQRIWQDSEQRADHLQIALELLRLERFAKVDPLHREPLAFTAIVLIMALLHGLERGSTRLLLPARGRQLETYLNELPLLPEERAGVMAWIPQLVQSELFLIGPPGEQHPLIVCHQAIYLHRLHHREGLLAMQLAQRAATHPDLDFKELAQRFESLGLGAHLSEEQLAAVFLAQQSPLTLITGGPGTGKTSVIISLLRLAMELGTAPSAIALSAPTGKAARRMAESIHSQLGQLPPIERSMIRALPTPQTLQRLLGLRGPRFIHNAHHPLPHQLVVVDEVSMIDLELMNALVDALAPMARLVLLGDADQLPSVGPGAILYELVRPVQEQPLGQHTRRLTKNFRMREDDPAGSQVLHCAAAIRQGQGQIIESMRHLTPEDLDHHSWEGLALLPLQGNDLQRILGNWLERRLPPQLVQALRRPLKWSNTLGFGDDTDRVEAIFANAERGRILCAIRKSPLGTEAINAEIHHRLAINLELKSELKWLPGEPLMITRNDYRRDLFNGDTGVALKVLLEGEQRPQLMAAFKRADASFALFPPNALERSLALAHAITIHKSQGSEFDEAIVMLPERSALGLSREGLYTAITRCRKSVLLAGFIETLPETIQRRTRRSTGLLERIHQFLASPQPRQA